jgi:Uma2 family endonuclease
MSTPPKSDDDAGYVTPEEYLRRERASEGRSEYRSGGRIVAMSGASWAHNLIAFNLVSQIRPHLRGTDYHGSAADMKVRLVGSFRYVYPDIVVVCGQPQFEDEQRTDIIANPMLIVEVLSASTESIDRGPKWHGYQQIPSLREYVLVTQDRAFVERFARHGDLWMYDAVEGIGNSLRLDSIGLTLPLAAVYEDVTFGIPGGSDGGGADVLIVQSAEGPGRPASKLHANLP